MANRGHRSRKAVRPELAASRSGAANDGAILPAASPFRSPVDRLTPIRRRSSQEDPRRIFRRTRRPAAERSHARRSRRRFHPGRAFPRAPPWLPPDYPGPDRSARGDGIDLLPQRSLVRIIGVTESVVIPRLAKRAEGPL